jgi:acyl carrier protein
MYEEVSEKEFIEELSREISQIRAKLDRIVKKVGDLPESPAADEAEHSEELLENFGFDSLKFLRLSREIKKEFSVEIPLKLLRTSNIDELGKMLENPQKVILSHLGNSIKYHEDTFLPATLCNHLNDLPKVTQMQRFFLTGATGTVSLHSTAKKSNSDKSNKVFWECSC